MSTLGQLFIPIVGKGEIVLFDFFCLLIIELMPQVIVLKDKYPFWNLGQGVGFTYNLRCQSVNLSPCPRFQEWDLHS